jgi:hypothetical protein
MPVNPILKCLDEERRRLAMDGDVVEILPDITRRRGVNGLWHNISYSSLMAENADRIIAGEIEHHRQLGVEFEWKLYAHDQPSDMLDRLARHGFQIGACEAVLVHEVNQWNVEHRVCAVETLEQIGIFRGVASEVFKKDFSLTAGELAQGIKSRLTQHRGYVAYIGDEPVGVGRLYTHPKSLFGRLYGGGVRTAYRSRGVYRALVAARARDAMAFGAKYLIVDALPTSRPILERLGFERVSETWPCVWKP